MADIQDFAAGANILQQVDVSEIFKSLAMGIAEAQQSLDDNSISQLQRLSETELAGKSLLELGFVPAFYAFSYADISANINLKMAEKSSLELGVEASFDFSSSNASESDFSDLSKESQYHSEKEEFKSNRRFSMTSKSSKRIKVNNQYYSLDQSKGCISKVEKLHDELLQDEKIERVNIQRSNAYTSVYQTSTNFSILSLTDLGTAGAAFTPAFSPATTTFIDVFTASGGLYGFAGSQIFGLAAAAVEMELFFDFDKDVIDFTYDNTVSGVSNKAAAFDALANILRLNPSLSVTIEGYTDSSGPNKYNDGLSTRRSNALRDWLGAKGVDLTQVHAHGNGETLALANNGPDSTKNPVFRKVKVTLQPNIYFIFIASATVYTGPSTGANFIIVVNTTTPDLVVINGNASGFVAAASAAAYIASNSTASSGHFHVETRENINYFLHEDTELTYMTYSADSETIEIAAEEGSEEEIKVYKNENSKERIKDLATKNNSNKTFAASASIDFRMSRQFEMSMEGSASMSARMVAVPPPDAFKTHIATIFNAG